jgi:tetratricopeptide (TPR) repeat protein
MMIATIRQRIISRSLLPVFCLLACAQVAAAQFQAHDEKKADALRALGDAEFDRGHLDKAKGYYLDAMQSNSTDAKTMLGMAKIAEKKGDLDEAIRRARMAVQYDSTNANVHVVLGSFLQNNQDFRGAELQYERAVELTKSKDDSALFCSMAIKSLVEIEDFERADKLSKLWLKEHSKYGQSHYDRGLVLMHSSKPVNEEEALKQFAKALELDPKLNIAHYQLGVLDAKLDQKESALKELNTFIENHPPPKELKLAKDQIDKLKAE